MEVPDIGVIPLIPLQGIFVPLAKPIPKSVLQIGWEAEVVLKSICMKP